MLMAGVILISFALLGGAFVTLSYQYAVQEKRDSLGDNAKYIAQSFMRSLSTASTTLGQQNDYAVNIDTLAKVSDSYVIVTETDGLIFYSSDGSDGSNLAGGVVPSSVRSAANSGVGARCVRSRRESSASTAAYLALTASY